MIRTNKDKMITLAVQGRIVPAQVERQYAATWDGRAKLCLGVGGINYNIKIGEKIFGWVGGDRVEPGIATDGEGKDNEKNSFRQKTGIGNEATVVSGQGKGENGVVTGKHGYRLPGGAHHVLMHFPDETLEKLSIGDKVRVKARSTGLKISGFEDVMVHSASPRLIEGIGIEEEYGKLRVPVVKVFPNDLIGAGFGTSANNSHIEIQTCFPPDIEKHRLDELRFGDLVALENILSDYGRQYYRGAMTIGVICSGPSEISGQGIGVTTIMSSRTSLIDPWLNPESNICKTLKI